jgi:leader peptidase (prepilin peptidase) / N-methyltransferase
VKHPLTKPEVLHEMTSRRALAVIALLAGAVAATSLLLFEPAWAIVSCLLGWTMLAIAVSDAERFIVPDVLSLPSIPAGLIVTRFLAEPEVARALVLEHCIAVVVGVAALYAVKQLYYVWRNREGLGLGDVKLAAVAGAWTGLQGLSYVLLLACVLAIAFVVLTNLRNLRSIEGTAAVPFGVFLGPSIWLVWCVGTLALQTEFATIGAL